MKESIGVLSLTNIVILFILVFTGYLCVMLNQTKAYNVKNEIITIIQKHNGLGDDALTEIKEYMDKVGYRSTGKCDKVDYNDGSITSKAIQTSGELTDSDNGMICITTHSINYNLNDPTGQFPNAAYYDVKVFFALDMPIINSVFNFNLRGNTKIVYCPKENGGCS